MNSLCPTVTDSAMRRPGIVTGGIDLNSLVGQRFKVGGVECIGRRLCEPCARLEQLTHRGVLRQLIHRGGLRADILIPGAITEGAAIQHLERDEASGPRGKHLDRRHVPASARDRHRTASPHRRCETVWCRSAWVQSLGNEG
jgi:MOSC domain-containing protein YiiM